MNIISRWLTGGIMALLGVGMLVGSFFVDEAGGPWVLRGYGALIFILALFVLFNKGEDVIEGRKDISIRSGVKGGSK